MHQATSRTIVAIIPARGGSKGIPHKNTALLNGRPLIDYTIQAALGSRNIGGTYVTSDSEAILEMARRLGAGAIKRPDELATDTASSESVVKHAISHMRSVMKVDPHIIVLLQPTSPLRNSEDIDLAFAAFFRSRANALISGMEPKLHPLKQMIIAQDGTLKTLTEDRTAPSKARQLLPRAFQPNGAIYIIETEVFLRTGLFVTDKTVPYYMDESKSIDIDTPEDLDKAERCLLAMQSAPTQRECTDLSVRPAAGSAAAGDTR
jgi:CMP-N,N'-diacetyllegionaminic acid synthase